MNGTSTTRISLLNVLRDEPDDDAAWGEFVRVYGPAVVTWCRERGLQHDDALDVTQDVLLRFWRTSKQFDYNPRGRFRNYLEQVARSALVRWTEQAGGPHDQATRSLLEKIPEREDLLARLAEAYDTELIAFAMAEVKTRVRPTPDRRLNCSPSSTAVAPTSPPPSTSRSTPPTSPGARCSG